MSIQYTRTQLSSPRGRRARTRASSAGWLFAHSRRDAVPFVVTLFQLASTLAVASCWDALSLAELAVLFPLQLALAWYNPIVSTHNFLHHPFFRARSLNAAYAALNSINLGLPQILYRHHHLNHHAFGNDRPDREGRTRDHSSTFAHGRDGQHEGALRYALCSTFREGTTVALKTTLRRGEHAQLLLETLVLVLGLVGLGWLSLPFLLWFWLPLWYLGWVLAQAENYYEHVGARTPGLRGADAVSFYGRFYNALFCNEGYHQEHHYRPGVHWTRRPAVRPLLAGFERTVASYPPLLGFLEQRRPPSLARAAMAHHGVG